MKRLTLLFGAMALSIQIAGCGGGSGASTATGSRADDPNLPPEVREFEAKDAKRAAERATKKQPGRTGKSSTRNR